MKTRYYVINFDGNGGGNVATAEIDLNDKWKLLANDRRNGDKKDMMVPVYNIIKTTDDELVVRDLRTGINFMLFLTEDAAKNELKMMIKCRIKQLQDKLDSI